jgi:CubicO group peptidase (beta-lactamase class C family)
VTDLAKSLAVLERGIREGLHPGAQLYVSLRGRTVGDHALGEARPGVPMTPDTLVLWLSASKPVAAVAIGQLWERGLLRLDDPLALHVPEFGQGGKEAITIRHALTHTGGFRLLQVGWPEVSWDETIAKICASRREPRWEPGEKAGYHQSSSWFLLGEVVHRLTNRSFADYVREAIFAPLGMADSWIGMPPEVWRRYHTERRLAVWWDTEASPPKPHAHHEELPVVRCSPGGNGWGPMRELGQFYEALLAGGERGGRRLLWPQTVEALTARHRVGMVDHTFRQVMDWGLGFIPNSRPGLVETWASLLAQERIGTATGASSAAAVPRPPDPALPYHYGPYASRRAWGHSGYRSSTAFADPAHGLVVAAAVTGTPSDAAHSGRFRALLAAIYEDLGLAPSTG